MFRKLISNLPFNPSLLGTVAFYSARMRQEESLRRLGFGFVALAMFIQAFAVIAPPEPTLAASDNDIIRGGFQSKEEAVQICYDYSRDVSLIYSTVGITCEDIERTTVITIRSTDYDGQLYSMGRHARGAVGKNNKPTDEYAINYFGGTAYMRRLASFDTGAYSTYKVLAGTTADGKAFKIMFDCGNPVLIGRYAPPPPTQVVDNSACEVIAVPPYVYRGEQFSATIRVNNTGGTTWDPSAGYKIGSQDPQDNGNWGTGRVNLPGVVAPGEVRDIAYTFTAPSNPGTYAFSWKMLQEGVRWFGTGCSKPIIIKLPPVPTPDPIPTPTPQPEPAPTPAPKDICPNLPGTQTKKSDCPDDVCPNIDGVQTQESQCIPCEDSLDENDIASCLVISKIASNRSQNIEDANGTTAAASDEIVYTLSVTNQSNKPLNDFVFEEALGDVLEYADLKTYENARFDAKTKLLTWPATTIDADATVTKSFTIKIKDTIPETPVSASDATSYDLTMTNVFHGVTVNIKVPPSIAKTTEQIVTTLPSTGPGTSLAIGFVIVTITAYFLARSWLLRKELDIIRGDFAHSGGI